MADKATVERLKDLPVKPGKILRLCHKGATHIGGDLSGRYDDGITNSGMYVPNPPKDRDRFILSKGHGAGCLYVTLPTIISPWISASKI